MGLYTRIADLPVTIDSVDRRQYTSETTSDFTRTTTEYRLGGDGACDRRTHDHCPAGNVRFGVWQPVY
ncbi:hypothetical protein EKH57_17715 (plasmid) [Halorubrum sp. BOL3-1]|nr:hypothetical protein EKH57_17715 [Halorubrum sp. BOL3-1]